MKNTSTVETKAETKQSVFRYILNHGPVTKQDIYIHLGISLPTIKLTLEYLLKQELIREYGKVKNTGGRNAVTYSVAENSRFTIGVFLSGHHISAVCVNLMGEVVASVRTRILLDVHEDSYLRKIGQMVEQVREEAKVPAEQLIGVGISVPSMVSRDGERIIFGMTHDFSGITRSVLSTYVPYPTRLYHDSQSAGFAEIWRNPTLKSAVYLNLNETVGACVILDGEIYYGRNGYAGEFGHIKIDPKHGKKCYCGKIGCLDTVCNTAILDACGGGSLEAFFAKVDEKDAEALACWNEYLDSLALGIHNLRMMFDCPFIVGGYLGSHIGNHINDLREKIDEMAIFTPYSRDYVLHCRYDREVNCAGAAIQVISEFMNNLE